MDRRLATHHMNTPMSQDVVLPMRPTPSVQIEPVAERSAGTERLVTYEHAAIPAECAYRLAAA